MPPGRRPPRCVGFPPMSGVPDLIGRESAANRGVYATRSGLGPRSDQTVLTSGPAAG